MSGWRRRRGPLLFLYWPLLAAFPNARLDCCGRFTLFMCIIGFARQRILLACPYLPPSYSDRRRRDYDSTSRE
jgi:hypothetical protein